ncbi:MAG: hypothetical protein JW883_03710 [Deltaproteobacteria bacterium]|nr:hypothetical protein [Deltaproteobacteria bacterium]
MQVENGDSKKSNKKVIGIVLILYSVVHYLVFGFDVWVVLFLILGLGWSLRTGPRGKAKAKEDRKV